MSTKKKTAPLQEEQNRVSVRVPRGEDVYVCVNGVGYLLPAMQTSLVPPEVAREYERSERAKDRFYETANAETHGNG